MATILLDRAPHSGAPSRKGGGGHPGALAGGVLAESFGTRGGLWICVALDGCAALVLLWVSRRSRRAG
ncbi:MULTISPECIES: hypothetical protein [Amycolatopsis]|uniref:hypothetical protein n=1 Tax=Amycolatopsis TaxID=1813 RepID=UPI0017493327|nr:hypothetical protein [Amycolatopsis bullii]